jgi:hypothetical protein
LKKTEENNEKTLRSIGRRCHDDGCRQRGELSSSLASFETILGRFLSPNHRAMHADQVQVRVRVRAFRVPQRGSTL